jgi:hypothetical protein
LEITQENQGKRVFRTDLSENEYFLNWGDPLVLLHDVSQLFSSVGQTAYRLTAVSRGEQEKGQKEE